MVLRGRAYRRSARVAHRRPRLLRGWIRARDTRESTPSAEEFGDDDGVGGVEQPVVARLPHLVDRHLDPAVRAAGPAERGQPGEAEAALAELPVQDGVVAHRE